MRNRKKDKYFFNPESLQFESVRQSIWQTIRRVSSVLVTSFLIAALYYAGYSLFFDTPMERAKKRENELLRVELDKINTRYDQLEKVIGDIMHRDTLIYQTIFEANPLNLNALSYNAPLTSYYEVVEKSNNNELILDSRQKLSFIQQSAKRQTILLDSLKVLTDKKKEELSHTPAILPVKNAEINSAGASVGQKINPFFKSLSMHTGMDFAVPVGAEVVATADGTVREIWYSLYGSGNRIVIDHGNSYETRYLYLNEIKVKKGANVTRGQVIGLVGNLGMTVPHLHYEVRKGGKIADPLNYFFLEITPQQYEQIMIISLNNGQSLD